MLLMLLHLPSFNDLSRSRVVYVGRHGAVHDVKNSGSVV
jgi:hypothetical protein